MRTTLFALTLLLFFGSTAVGVFDVRAEEAPGDPVGIPSLVVTMPVLTVTQTVTATEIAGGEQATFTVVIQNTGTGDAKQVLLTGALSDGLTYTDGGGTTRTWNVGETVAAGASVTVHASVTAPSVDTTASFTSTVSASAQGIQPVTAATTLTVTAPSAPEAVPAPRLSALLLPRALVLNPGQTGAGASVTVRNTGTAAATNVAVRVDLPNGVTFSDTGAGTHTWTLEALAPNEKQSIVLTLDTADTASLGAGRITATVVGDSTETVRTTASVDVRAGSVLGATTLPETGGTPWNFVVLGAVLAFLGARRIRAAEQLP